jgi:hypothetical protein
MILQTMRRNKRGELTNVSAVYADYIRHAIRFVRPHGTHLYQFQTLIPSESREQEVPLLTTFKPINFPPLNGKTCDLMFSHKSQGHLSITFSKRHRLCENNHMLHDSTENS